MEFWKLFKPKACNLKLQGTSKEEVFRETVETLERAAQLTPEQGAQAVQALLDRERKASTGVGMNVAVPHVVVEGLDHAVVSLSLHPRGVDWNALDGEPVHILFTVLRPGAPGEGYDPQRHLEMMRWISRLCREPDFRRFALGVRTRTELIELLKEMSAV